MDYYVGDTFSLQGGSVTVYFTDDSMKTVTITAADVSVSSVDMSTAGTKTITVTYKGESATFDIMVNAIVLDSIEATFDPGDQMIYTSTTLDSLKQYLQVVGENNNGSTTDALASGDYTLSGTLEVGESTITVTYNTLIDTFDVDVVAVEISSYEIKTPATKTTFAYQEVFDAAGLVVERVYNDGSRQDEILANYTIDSSAYNANVEGSYLIHIIVDENSVASYSVDVAATSLQLQAAKTTKIAEITDYMQADYYPEEWMALQAIKDGAITTINDFVAIGDVQNYDITSVNTNLEAVKTKVEIDAELAALLADTQDDKIEELTVYTEDDYYVSEWNDLEALYDAAVSDIRLLTTIAEVNDFDVASVNADMAAIKTKAMIDAEALAAAKASKLNVLSGIYANYTIQDYYPEQEAELQLIYTNAIDAINALTSITEVKEYDLDLVDDAMFALFTKEDVDDNALADAKLDKVALLDVEYEMFQLADYYPAEWTELQLIYINAKGAINVLSSIADVTAFDLTPIVAAMELVETRFEKDGAGSLTDYKDAKLAALLATLNGYDELDYYPAQWNELLAIYESAAHEIIILTIAQEVFDYNLAPSIVAMSEVATKTEVDAAMLAGEKIAKQAAVDAAYNAYDSNNYYPNQWAELSGIYDDITNAINMASTVAEIQAVDVNAALTLMGSVLDKNSYDLALQMLQNQKAAQVDSYYNSFNMSDYGVTEQAMLQNIRNDASFTIYTSTTLETVAAVDVEAIYAAMQEVKTLAELAQENYEQAKTDKWIGYTK